jgi:hypothetical protein
MGMFIFEKNTANKQLNKAIHFLRRKRRILFLTTSSRWVGEHGGERPKSTQLAFHLAQSIGRKKVNVQDVSRMNIYPCEGNVSTARGNRCGIQEAKLKDKRKNPTGLHRCFASMNHKDDELWKISKILLKSDCVVFFGSVRWGQMNAEYQKLIERLTWLENRHSTLGERNVLGDISAGIICVGQNWNGKNVLKTQKNVLKFFGFHVAPELCWNWQYTKNARDEATESYQNANTVFRDLYLRTPTKLRER